MNDEDVEEEQQAAVREDSGTGTIKNPDLFICCNQSLRCICTCSMLREYSYKNQR